MNQSRFSSRPIVALMTDFGLGDGDVGVMKGVIAGIIPEVHIIDVTHDVAPQNVSSGAWILASAYRYFPPGTVFVCVVDPGVGSSRGAIAVYAGDWYFVGPDNGLFSYIYMEQAVHQAVELNNASYHLSQVSSTFHGRDIFAPVGAHLAGGIVLNELGTELDPAALNKLDSAQPTSHGAKLAAHIVHVDNFGNLITSIPLSMVPELFTGSRVNIQFPTTQAVVDRRRRFFADGPDDGQPFIYGDSSGYVAIAVRNGDAAKTLNVGLGELITFVTINK